jgi:hypothetical protein
MTGIDTASAVRRVDENIVTTDRFVPHVSTVPATRGQTVGLFLREKALASTTAARTPHVVLMVHGGFAPSTVAYDLQYRDYSFMAALAGAGFDVFALSHTGYAPSPRPLMDDPCNVDHEFQPLLIPHVEGLAAPRYPSACVQPQRVDELETVVRFIMDCARSAHQPRGWSTGARARAGLRRCIRNVSAS